MNVWLATFGGLLPDLVDKPLSLVPGWDAGRSVAHSVLFVLALIALTRFHRAFLPIALGAATHLILDDPAVYMATFAWPLLGHEFTPDDDMSPEALHRHLTKPRTSFAEILGGLVLLAVAAQHAWSAWRTRSSAPLFPQIGKPLESMEPRRIAAPTESE